jgi:hypothetical protein
MPIGVLILFKNTIIIVFLNKIGHKKLKSLKTRKNIAIFIL